MKIKKIILIILTIIIGFIVLDTIQARIFKHSPLISWKEKEADSDSWIDRGILMDTYHCTHEQDIVTVYWKFKTSKFSCPVDEETYEQINDYDLDMFVNENANTQDKILIFKKYNQKYYYINEKYNLYINSYDLTADTNVYTKYTFKEVIEKDMISFDNILDKAEKEITFKDGGSKIYYYKEFNILVCNTISGNNDIIIGGEEIDANICQ